VSMGMTSAVKGRQIIDNAWSVLAIEFMAAAQGMDFLEPARPGPAGRAAYEAIRGTVDFLDDDRPLYDDINNLTETVRSGRIIEAVEGAIGPLDTSPLVVKKTD